MTESEQILFSEKQRFNQLWLVLIGVCVFFMFGLYQQLYLGIPWGNNQTSNAKLIFVSVLVLLVVLFKNGRRLLIGTQKPNGMKEVLSMDEQSVNI